MAETEVEPQKNRKQRRAEASKLRKAKRKR